MKEINCLVCLNCNVDNDRCKKYGSDPDIAVRKCCIDGFKNYVIKVDYYLMESIKNSKTPEEEFETYAFSPSVNQNGTFFDTDCGKSLFSVNGFNAYHGKLCPACNYLKNKRKTLLMRGTAEAEEFLKRVGRN